MSGLAPTPLRRNALWAFVGQAFYLGCQWLLMAMFARFGGADAAGLFALGLAICAPVMVLANLHLRELQASDARDEFGFSERLAVRLGAVGLGFAGIAAIGVLAGWPTPQLLVILAVGLAKSVESLADLGYGAMQAHERFAAITTAQILRATVGLTAGTVMYVLTTQVHFALMALALSWALTIVLFDLPRVAAIIAPSPLRPTITRKRLMMLLRQALPMGLVSGLGTVTLLCPSYVIQHQLGTDDLGHYTAASYLLLVGNVAALALGQATVPALARAFAAGKRRLYLSLVGRLCCAVLGLGALAILVCWLMGGTVLALAYGESWRAHATLLIWLAAAAATQWFATVFGFAATAARRLDIQVPIGIGACLISAMTSWWFITSAGLIGAAWSGMVTCMMLAVSHAILVLRRFPQDKAATT